MSEDETPYEHEEAPSADAAEEDVPNPAVAVEPRLGFSEFAGLAQLSGPAVAAFRQWLRTQHLTPDGHYTLDEWREYRAGMLAHT